MHKRSKTERQICATVPTRKLTVVRTPLLRLLTQPLLIQRPVALLRVLTTAGAATPKATGELTKMLKPARGQATKAALIRTQIPEISTDVTNLTNQKMPDSLLGKPAALFAAGFFVNSPLDSLSLGLPSRTKPQRPPQIPLRRPLPWLQKCRYYFCDNCAPPLSFNRIKFRAEPALNHSIWPSL